jgi:hypothetical protein
MALLNTAATRYTNGYESRLLDQLAFWQTTGCILLFM